MTSFDAFDAVLEQTEQIIKLEEENIKLMAENKQLLSTLDTWRIVGEQIMEDSPNIDIKGILYETNKHFID